MARVTGILVKHRKGEAWDSRISLPGATRNLAKPQDRPDMAGGDGISDPGESQLHVHLAQITGSPLAHFVSTPRSHLQSPTAPSFSLRNLARQSVTKMSAEGNPAPLRGAAKGEAPRYLPKRAAWRRKSTACAHRRQQKEPRSPRMLPTAPSTHCSLTIPGRQVRGD